MNKIGWIVAGGLAILLVALAIYNSGSGDNRQDAFTVWSQPMATGDSQAPNTMAVYTDVTCPYCAEFQNTANQGSFNEDYIDSGKVNMEIRVTSLLSNVNSVRSGETAYCAADQDKFFEYYNNIVGQLTTDYFDKNIGVSPTGPKVPQLDDQYYLDVAKDSGLDVDAMKSCLVDGEMAGEVSSATQRAINMGVSGVPAFDINNGAFTGSGFGGGYTAIEQMMRAGGVN